MRLHLPPATEVRLHPSYQGLFVNSAMTDALGFLCIHLLDLFMHLVVW